MKQITLLVSLFFVFTILGQSNEIYGIARNSNPNVTYLAKVNTTSGLVQDISDMSYSPFIANFSFTVDPFLGIYYYANTETFIGLDMSTGALVSESPITTSLEPVFQNFIYNEMTEEIIGIERGGFESGTFLSKIDPETGIVTPISTVPFANTNTITVAGAAIDIRNQWYHIFSDGRLLAIEIETGTVVHEPVVDTSQFENFNNLFFNAANSKLYAIGRNNAPNELFLVQIDPITGAVTTISPSSIGESLELEGSALDPFAGIYYFKRPNPTSIVGVDVTTGLEVSATPFDLSTSNGAFFGYFYFGGETRSLLLSSDTFLTTNVTSIYPNPTQNKLNISGNSINRITLFTLTGQLLEDNMYNGIDFIELDVSKYSKGLYFLTLLNAQQEAVTVKFMKE